MSTNNPVCSQKCAKFPVSNTIWLLNEVTQKAIAVKCLNSFFKNWVVSGPFWKSIAKPDRLDCSDAYFAAQRGVFHKADDKRLFHTRRISQTHLLGFKIFFSKMLRRLSNSKDSRIDSFGDYLKWKVTPLPRKILHHLQWFRAIFYFFFQLCWQSMIADCVYPFVKPISA